MQQNTRDPAFDIAKFFAIFLVVLGHVMGKTCDNYPVWLSNFIVGINMPLFFAISGYFAYSTLDKLDTARLIRHIRSYFWPFAIVSCIFALLAWPLGLLVSPTTTSTNPLILIPIYAVKRFLFAGWFLWSLAIMYISSFIACYLASLFNLPRWLMLALAYLVMLLIPEGVWYMGYTRSLYAFFLLGSFALRPLIGFVTASNDRLVIACILPFVYCLSSIILPSLNSVGLSFYDEPTSIYVMLSNPLVLGYLILRFIYATPVIIGILFLVRKVPHCGSKFAIYLASFGTTTLGVYVLHEWLLDRLVSMANSKCSIFVSCVVAILLFSGCHYIVRATSGSNKIRKLLWGKL